MSDTHIIPLLDNNRFRSLSGPDAVQLEIHIAQCDGCRAAYLAAQATSELLRARVAESITPPPFFSTRVMALVREQRNEPSLFDLVTLWKAARGFVLSTASVVVLLAAITFLTPQPGTNGPLASWQTSDATAGVVFGDEATRLDETSNEQVVDVVFTPEETDATDQK